MPKKSTELRHIAIICDGNRRWAKAHGWEVFRGHEHAVKKTTDDLIDRALERGIKYLTFWMFSTENWDRNQKEIDFLMNLFRLIFDQKIKNFGEKNIRVKVIGDRTRLADDIQKRIVEGEELTKRNTQMTVTLALNYGGRDELVRAVKKMHRSAEKGQFDFDELDEQKFATFLDTAYMPDPDLIIRTSGEQRMSGFMSWQQQYAEFYFTDVPFPDFTGDELDKAIAEYAKRQRRFGGG